MGLILAAVQAGGPGGRGLGCRWSPPPPPPPLTVRRLLRCRRRSVAVVRRWSGLNSGPVRLMVSSGLPSGLVWSGLADSLIRSACHLAWFGLVQSD